jgi:hypothetical protein
MAFEIFEEVVPELIGKPFDEVSAWYRNWCNSPEQDDVREWLRRPLSPEERKTMQSRFRRNWYEAHGGTVTYLPTTGIPQAGEPSGT